MFDNDFIISITSITSITFYFFGGKVTTKVCNLFAYQTFIFEQKLGKLFGSNMEMKMVVVWVGEIVTIVVTKMEAVFEAKMETVWMVKMEAT